MVAAAALALIIHAVVFFVVEHIKIKRSIITAPAPKIVTVTMSHRAPAPHLETKKNVKKKQPLKKTYTPKKPPPPEDLIKPELPESMPEPEKPVTEKKEAVVKDKIEEENDIIDDTAEKGPPSPTHGSSTANITAPVEAVPLYNINPPPKYPRIAIKRGYQGTAELMVLVNINGTVDDAWLFESSGYSILDNAALQSVRNWSFTPGKQGNHAIEMWVRVPVRFQLQ
jgi:periplasmic protein TonB